MRSFREIVSILNARGYLRFVSDRKWIEYRFFQTFDRKLDLDRPSSFNEKLQWLKLNYKNPMCTLMVDKITAKDYVAEHIGDDIEIIPTLGVWDSFDEIEWNSLPEQFVLKCNHDSGGLVICRDKSHLDKEAAKRKINKCLKKNYFWHGREWVYKDTKPRILAEKYMENEGQPEISDYKFYCFDGEVKCLYVSTGMENHHTARVGFFDTEFKPMPFKRTDYETYEKVPEIPTTFEKMKELAARLSKGFPFLRVDLYEIDGKVYFSELTFIPCSGWMTFEPEAWDFKMGEWLTLPK